MESLNIKKLTIESKKGNKIQKQKQLKRIGNLLRYAEICVLLVLISRVSLQQLPLALKNSTEYLRGLFTISPLVVFLIGNIIIITLFVQSGHFSHPSSSTKRGSDSESDLYLEFLQNQNIQIADRKRISIKDRKMDGCMMKQESEKQSTSTKGGDRVLKVGEKKRVKGKMGCEVKEYRRCESEIMLVKGVESEVKQLQRCESEKSRGSEEDGMSNDEFRRTVEAFISRQQRLRLRELQTL